MLKGWKQSFVGGSLPWNSSLCLFPPEIFATNAPVGEKKKKHAKFGERTAGSFERMIWNVTVPFGTPITVTVASVSSVGDLFTDLLPCFGVSPFRTLIDSSSPLSLASLVSRSDPAREQPTLLTAAAEESLRYFLHSFSLPKSSFFSFNNPVDDQDLSFEDAKRSNFYVRLSCNLRIYYSRCIIMDVFSTLFNAYCFLWAKKVLSLFYIVPMIISTEEWEPYIFFLIYFISRRE